MTQEHLTKEGLVRLLQTDFSIPEGVINPGLIPQRLFSPEGTSIAQQATFLLESSYISRLGRIIISSAIKMAYAEMSRVPAEISPSALGLDGAGLGIYDRDLAFDLEARLYRASLARKIQALITVHNLEEEQFVAANPTALVMMSDTFFRWGQDIIKMHGKTPMDFETFNPIALATRGEDIDPASSLGQMIRHQEDSQFSNN